MDLVAPEDGAFWWVGWRDMERMSGIADDKTNAFCALLHFIDPDEWGAV